MENKEQEFLPNTVYNCLNGKNQIFSKKDLRKISNAINMHYKKKFGETAEPEKIEQKEGEQTFSVYCYPDDMRMEMENIIDWFFRIKKNREKQHVQKLLDDKLEKLRKTSPEEYAFELARISEEAKAKKQAKMNKTKNQKYRPKKSFASKPNIPKKEN